MYIRYLSLALRARRSPFSTSKNINVSSARPPAPDSSTAVRPEKAPEQEFISPLYTQKVGMFSRPGVLFSQDKKARFRAYTLYAITVVSFVVFFSMVKIIPPGHVGIIRRKDGAWRSPAGSLDQFNNKGRLAMLHIPFVETPVAFRITPIRKKIIRTCETADARKLEVVVFLTLTAKEPFAAHIYSIFGVNFSNAFVEKELHFDLDQVVRKFRLDELIFAAGPAESLEFQRDNVYKIDSAVDRANEEIIQRFEDAGAFNKIVVSDVNISYRRPDLPGAPAPATAAS